jgi:hypothetical protein
MSCRERIQPQRIPSCNFETTIQAYGLIAIDLIHTSLQRGDGARRDWGNRFNGLLTKSG